VRSVVAREREKETQLVITNGIRSAYPHVETYLSPRAPWTEGVSAAGEETLAVAEQHLDVIATILDALAFILTGVNLVLWRGPRGVLQVLQRRQRQTVQIVPGKTRFTVSRSCSSRVIGGRVLPSQPRSAAINSLKTCSQTGGRDELSVVAKPADVYPSKGKTTERNEFRFFREAPSLGESSSGEKEGGHRASMRVQRDLESAFATLDGSHQSWMDLIKRLVEHLRVATGNGEGRLRKPHFNFRSGEG
jgi:hypothetical protein